MKTFNLSLTNISILLRLIYYGYSKYYLISSRCDVFKCRCSSYSRTQHARSRDYVLDLVALVANSVSHPVQVALHDPVRKRWKVSSIHGKLCLYRRQQFKSIRAVVCRTQETGSSRSHQETEIMMQYLEILQMKKEDDKC